MSPRHAAAFAAVLGTLALAACAPAQLDWQRAFRRERWIALDPLREDFTPGVAFNSTAVQRARIDGATARLLSSDWTLEPTELQFADSASLSAIEVGARAKPDDLIGSALKSAGAAQVSTALKSATVTFSKWGKSERQSVTLDELTRGIMRTRFDLEPGNPERVDLKLFDAIGLSAPREEDRRNRWVVYESLALTGAQFTTNREVASNLEVGLDQAGLGGVVRVASTEGETSTFVIDRTRTVAFKAARLVRVEPSVPPGNSAWPVDANGNPEVYRFVWRTEPAGSEQTVTMRRVEFRDSPATETTAAAPPDAGMMAQPTATIDPNAPPKITVAIRLIENGTSRIITTADEVPTGAALGFDVTLDRPGYLYLANEDETGHWQILAPKTGGHGNSYGPGTPLQPNRTFRVPYDLLSVTELDEARGLSPDSIGWEIVDRTSGATPKGHETFYFYTSTVPSNVFQRAEPGNKVDVALRSMGGLSTGRQNPRTRPEQTTLAPARISPDDPLIQPHTIFLRRRNKP